MSSSQEHDWRELAARQGDGLEISLVWSKAADRVKVVILDATLGERFDIEVDGADALTAFEHPFAYAAHRRAVRTDDKRDQLTPQHQRA